MTRFRDAKVCNNLATDEIDDRRIQSDYKCTIGLQNSRGKNSVLGIGSAWWNRARHQWQRDHQGYCACVLKPSTTPQPRSRPTSTQSTWNSTLDMSMRLVLLSVLVSFCLRQHIHELHTTSRGSRLKGVAHVISSMHEVCGSPSTLISILFHFIIFQFILNLLHFLLHFFHYLEGSSNTAYSA